MENFFCGKSHQQKIPPPTPKFCNWKTFSQGLWGVMISPKAVIQPFNYAEQNGYLKILIGQFWEKIAWEEAYLPSNIFGHLKRELELLISVQMSLVLDIFGSMDRYDSPLKTTTTNKPTSVIFFLAKKQNSTFLPIEASNLYSRVLWYAESDSVIFIRILWLLGVFPLFSKMREIFWGS